MQTVSLAFRICTALNTAVNTATNQQLASNQIIGETEGGKEPPGGGGGSYIQNCLKAPCVIGELDAVKEAWMGAAGVRLDPSRRQQTCQPYEKLQHTIATVMNAPESLLIHGCRADAASACPVLPHEPESRTAGAATGALE